MLQERPAATLAASDPWQTILSQYATVGLDDIAESATSNRTDTKFLLRVDELASVLKSLDADYEALDIDGLRFTSYRTQYFDTEAYDLFRRHHIGGTNRCKVRTRIYLNSQLAFVEVKRKLATGVTSKVRQPTSQFQTELLTDACAFVDAHSEHRAETLRPALQNSFDRICLVSHDRAERLTIDLDVAVVTAQGSLHLPHIAIAEFKQERHAAQRKSTFLRAMRKRRIRPSGFSKYCMGLLLTQPEIKHNLFKPQLKQLRRLMGEPNVVC